MTCIESINDGVMSIIGDMKITRTAGNPESFISRYSPKARTGVVLKYDFSSRCLSYPHAPRGLRIRPALNSDGINNDNWNALISFASECIKTDRVTVRP